ncbi:hypothetical protein H4J57_19210 [Colwellia sp. BRX8-7]|jgi:hypothetical protein|uniref:hypothetical protein n=1 Tax=Alteromonadales TaxID=135622 RepID=UPI0015F77E51|nr:MULTISPECIES: hypothetical protein [Alteromonadales]MBA6339318.1 hypothetical protein [Colwellia sp. BRX8-7]
MDVKDFVSETLRQVTEAIEENESSLDSGGKYLSHLKDLNMFSLNGGWVTHVDFDIAITESRSKEGGAKLSIAGVGGLGGDLSEGTETASRVKFRVPLQIKSKVST